MYGTCTKRKINVATSINDDMKFGAAFVTPHTGSQSNGYKYSESLLLILLPYDRDKRRYELNAEDCGYPEET